MDDQTQTTSNNQAFSCDIPHFDNTDLNSKPSCSGCAHICLTVEWFVCSMRNACAINLAPRFRTLDYSLYIYTHIHPRIPTCNFTTWAICYSCKLSLLPGPRNSYSPSRPPESSCKTTLSTQLRRVFDPTSSTKSTCTNCLVFSVKCRPYSGLESS
jgi:hypothetical protein